ncbi:MAG: DUF309 domain-containing protein [Thermosynechococcaceae cyanobacterium MS004]|nr:DUF309 domain-containing protein [Thermosynechococcaceae cyanobacterium MS004]
MNTSDPESLPPSFWQGVEEFRRGEFYACHDTLEALWIEAQEPDKTFFQGILQIAVACYHLGNQNWRGAVILLGEGTRRLVSYRPAYGGIDVETLVVSSLEFLTYLQTLGEERVSEASRLLEPILEPSDPLQDRMNVSRPVFNAAGSAARNAASSGLDAASVLPQAFPQALPQLNRWRS